MALRFMAKTHGGFMSKQGESYRYHGMDFGTRDHPFENYYAFRPPSPFIMIMTHHAQEASGKKGNKVHTIMMLNGQETIEETGHL